MACQNQQKRRASFFQNFKLFHLEILMKAVFQDTLTSDVASIFCTQRVGKMDFMILIDSDQGSGALVKEM